MASGREIQLLIVGCCLALAADCGLPTEGRSEDGGAPIVGETTVAAMAVIDPGEPPEPPCDQLVPFEPGDADGHASPLAFNAGQSRAGRMRAADLPADRSGLAQYRAGDFVLANGHIALLIEAARPSNLYDPWGGKPVGLARVRDGRLVDAADFNEVIYGIGRHGVATTSVGVLRDGASGGAAVVRAIGMLKPVPFMDEFGRMLAPADYSDVRVAIDYELEPDAETVDVYMTFEIKRNTAVDVRTVLHGFFQHYRMPRFTPERGFVAPTGPTPYTAFVDDDGMSYAWMSPDSDLRPFVSVTGFDLYTSMPLRIPACAMTRRHIARLVAGGPGLDGLQQALARLQSQTLREIHGTVTDAAGIPAPGVRVHAESLDRARYFTRASSDAAGQFVLHVPETEAVRLTGWRSGDAVTRPVNVAVGTEITSLRLAPTGTIEITATEDGTQRPLPVRIQVLPISRTGLPAVRESFGEAQFGSGRLHVAFPTNGLASLRAPVGRYRVIASHGFEYDIVDREIEVAAGAATVFPVTLRHVVDSTGVMCGDFHIHTSRSPDAGDSARLKLASIVADGVEVAVRSDHDYVADFEPLIHELGLEQWAFGVPSIELTTFTWGHFGVVPVTPDPSLPNDGSFEWQGRLPRDVFAAARARSTAPTVIINHPRAHGPAAGLFEVAGFDPVTGVPSRPEYWDTGFTAIEVFNNSDFEANRGGTVRDWFSLLNHGRNVFAVGSSDSHNLSPSAPVGYPRTCMTLATDDPRAVTATQIRDAVATGHSTISGGIFVTAAIVPHGPAEQSHSAHGRTRFAVSVQAPTWVPAARLEVIVDGITVQTIALNAGTADPSNPVVRFRRNVEVPGADRARYVIFVVHGDRDLSPVHPEKRAFGVTNPIFLTH